MNEVSQNLNLPIGKMQQSMHYKLKHHIWQILQHTA